MKSREFRILCLLALALALALVLYNALLVPSFW